MGEHLFLRGNHEDFAWLAGLAVEPASGTAAVDPFDLLRYVPDGTVLRRNGTSVAFLGGIETPEPHDQSLDPGAYAALLALPPRTVDVLVTHEPPYGVDTGHDGRTQGSAKVRALVEALQPAYHIAGHLHHIIGPHRYGAATYLGISSLVASVRWNPDARGLLPGRLAVLDTATADLHAVTDAWLGAVPTPFDFDAWASGLLPD